MPNNLTGAIPTAGTVTTAVVRLAVGITTCITIACVMNFGRYEITDLIF